ncbi:glycosyltransferase Family 4 family protein [Klebsiella oxytoca]|nr:glycosyltransferase Family 4 family protein [Klebsiella oxytoca]
MIVNSLYYPYKFGGAEISVQFLAEELVKRNITVRIITLNNSDEIIYDTINGVEIVSVPLQNIYWPYSSDSHGVFKKIQWHFRDTINQSMAEVFKKQLNEFKPDLVHTNNLAGFSVSIWNMVKACKLPLVHTARDYYLFHPNSTLFNKGMNMSVDSISVKLLSYLKKKTSQKVDAFVGISEFISHFHKDNGFAKKAEHRHIYNPINKINFNKKQVQPCLTIGFLGRLTSEKGFDIFIKFARKYSKDIKFIAAGNPSSSEDSRELCLLAQKAGIELKGYIPASELLSIVDALLLPTKWNEPFGRVVAEAAISGIPVFTNLTGGVKEISEHYNWVRAIEEFEPSIIRKLQTLADNSEDVNQPFNGSHICEQYISLYSEVLNKKLTPGINED